VIERSVRAPDGGVAATKAASEGWQNPGECPAPPVVRVGDADVVREHDGPSYRARVRARE
jgi:hypothetical protein